MHFMFQKKKLAFCRMLFAKSFETLIVDHFELFHQVIRVYTGFDHFDLF